MIRLGPTRLGLLGGGVLKEWDWSSSSDMAHDGVDRVVHMNSLEADLALHRAAAKTKEVVVDWSGNSWMDDTGEAEASKGDPPTTVRNVAMVTPTSVGYLPGNRFLFAHLGRGEHDFYGRLPIVDVSADGME